LRVSTSSCRPIFLWFPCVLVLLLVLSTRHTLGQSPDTSDDRLAAEEAKLEILNERLTSLRKELGSLDQKQTTLLGELHKLEIQIRVAKEELELMKLQLDRGYREIDTLLKRIQGLEKSIMELRPFLANRSVSLYKLGRLSYVRLLLSVEEPNQLTRAYRYISRLAQADGEKISRFIADQRALEESKSRLVARTKEMLEVRNQLEATTQTLQRRRATKETLLGEIHERREMTETLMYELEEARGKLGDLMTRLVRGELPLEDPVFLPIRLFRGELAWPVDGEVSSHFGKQYHPRFRTVTVQNGVEIAASLSAPVDAVYDGHVVFASWFQGYGKLLIIGHPGNVHTLYGHLSDIKVKNGDIVHRGDEVAWVGDTGSLSGPSLYFEIREDGKPVDPEEWLTKAVASKTRAVTP
jgi:septal ring factor EnvC (AmiA/AmiB activator)